MSADFDGRHEMRESRRRRRRRKVMRSIVRTFIWLLVLAGVFVLGIGYGRVASDESLESGLVTIERDRGAVTATLPTETVVETKTVTKIKRVRRRR